MQDTDTYSTRSVGVSEVAAAYGVSVATVRNWDNKLSYFRTPGNQRRYRLSDNPELASLLATPSASAFTAGVEGVSLSAETAP